MRISALASDVVLVRAPSTGYGSTSLTYWKRTSENLSAARLGRGMSYGSRYLSASSSSTPAKPRPDPS